MARILFDFECRNCTHTFEDLVDTSDCTPPVCPECGAYAHRLITGTRMDPRLGVNAAAFPTMGDKWARIRVQRQKIEAKRARDHGPDA